MQKTPTESIHTRYIRDRTDIITDIGIHRDNTLETLEDAIAYNAINPNTQIRLDAYEDGRFLEICIGGLNQLDKVEPEKAQKLLIGLREMLDEAGKNILKVYSDIILVLS